MKIVHFIDYFQPKIGYQEYFLALYHKKMGHEVFVVTSDRYYPFQNFDQTFSKILGRRFVGHGIRMEQGLKTYRLKSIEVPNSPLIFMPDLTNVIKKISPDVIICHGVYSPTSYIIAGISKSLKIKLIYDTHAAAFNTDFSASVSKRFYHIIQAKLFRPAILSASYKIFAIGVEERDFLSKDFRIDKSQIPIIQLGVDTDRFYKNNAFGKKIRQELGFLENDKVVIYCGKISPEKDIEVLIDAFNIQGNKDAKFLIVGGGDNNYIKFIISKLDKKIEYMHIPYVANKDLPGFLSTASLGIWPGNPSTGMLEALACGVPLILPKMKENEYLKKSGAVVRFKRGDSRMLGVLIDRILKNSSSRYKMSLKGIEFIQNNLSWKILAQKVLDL